MCVSCALLQGRLCEPPCLNYISKWAPPSSADEADLILNSNMGPVLTGRRERTGAKHAVKVGGAAGKDGAVAVEAPARRRSLPKRPRRLGYQHHVRVLGVVEQRGQVCQVAIIMHDDLSTCTSHVKGRCASGRVTRSLGAPCARIGCHSTAVARCPSYYFVLSPS